MAQRVQTLLIDDLDGGEAEGTIRFGLDGAEYEIDLSAGHADALRRALAPYVSAARRAPGAAARRPGRAGAGPRALALRTRWRCGSGPSRRASRSRTGGGCRPSWS
jgi:Lsr2